MIIYLDTETTGLKPGNICQLSYILQDSFGVQAKNFFFTVDAVEYSAYMVHGFSVPELYRLSGGKRFSCFANEIAFDIKNADAIVAHNVDFDLSFLRAEFSNLDVPFNYKQAICSMKTAVPVCKLLRSRGVGYKYPKLTELCAFLDISEDKIMEYEKKWFGTVSHSHDARFDTVALALCCNKAMEAHEEFSFFKELL
jgi:DNA polymerase-3 subunit epsilon